MVQDACLLQLVTPTSAQRGRSSEIWRSLFSSCTALVQDPAPLDTERSELALISSDTMVSACILLAQTQNTWAVLCLARLNAVHRRFLLHLCLAFSLSQVVSLVTVWTRLNPHVCAFQSSPEHLRGVKQGSKVAYVSFTLLCASSCLSFSLHPIDPSQVRSFQQTEKGG